MKFIRYDIQGSTYENVKLDPLEQMKKLGFKLIHYYPRVYDDVLICCVEDYTMKLPSYIFPNNPYNLNYWRDKCWENCEYFKKSFDIKTQTRYSEFDCHCGEKCLKEINN